MALLHTFFSALLSGSCKSATFGRFVLLLQVTTGWCLASGFGVAADLLLVCFLFLFFAGWSGEHLWCLQLLFGPGIYGLEVGGLRLSEWALSVDCCPGTDSLTHSGYLS